VQGFCLLEMMREDAHRRNRTKCPPGCWWGRKIQIPSPVLAAYLLGGSSVFSSFHSDTSELASASKSRDNGSGSLGALLPMLQQSHSTSPGALGPPQLSLPSKVWGLGLVEKEGPKPSFPFLSPAGLTCIEITASREGGTWHDSAPQCHDRPHL
jgi:hypothetical protein